MKFRIGDKVMLNPKVNDKAEVDKIGIATITNYSIPTYCEIETTKGQTYHVPIDCLIPYEAIIIYRTGDTIVAEGMGEHVEISEENFLSGAKKAMTQLSKVLSEPYNDKLVCIDSVSDMFTVGKIYFVKDGILYSGETAVNVTAYRNFAALTADMKKSKFIPLVD